ncbi:MAG: class I SAM-dependent methyltransferase [Terriglobia bacterium]|jgi:SAM-dependent methyltransferase
MQNKGKWVPSKFVLRKGALAASRNRSEVGAGSRLIADIVAGYYGAHIPQYARGRLLDLGCGKVPLYEAYRSYVTENVCIDWENTPHKNEYLDATCDLTQRLPYDDGEFDTIILSDVLEHIPQPENLWREMSRVLKPGGNVLLSVPFYYWLHETPYDFYRYTEFALRRFADSSHFKVRVLDATGGTPEILADLLAKQAQVIPVIGRGVAIVVQSATRVLLKTGLGRKCSEKTRKKFPLGYFMVAEKLPLEPSVQLEVPSCAGRETSG